MAGLRTCNAMVVPSLSTLNCSAHAIQRNVASITLATELVEGKDAVPVAYLFAAQYHTLLNYYPSNYPYNSSYIKPADYPQEQLWRKACKKPTTTRRSYKHESGNMLLSYSPSYIESTLASRKQPSQVCNCTAKLTTLSSR